VFEERKLVLEASELVDPARLFACGLAMVGCNTGSRRRGWGGYCGTGLRI
jgi:hypothetical protein